MSQSGYWARYNSPWHSDFVSVCVWVCVFDSIQLDHLCGLGHWLLQADKKRIQLVRHLMFPFRIHSPLGFFSPPSQTCHHCRQALSCPLFLKCHVNGIIRCAVSGDWPFPQNNSLEIYPTVVGACHWAVPHGMEIALVLFPGGALFFLAFLTNDCVLVNPGCHLPGEVGKG